MHSLSFDADIFLIFMYKEIVIDVHTLPVSCLLPVTLLVTFPRARSTSAFMCASPTPRVSLLSIAFH